MNTRTIIITLAIFIFFLGLMPLAAQNSPSGGLATGNVINRDTDTYMMPNFAPFVNYDKVFSFVQGSVPVSDPINVARYFFTEPGLSAGFGTKIHGNLLHFYLNTTGFKLNNSEVSVDTGASKTETSEKSNALTMQFDTAFGNNDLGVFKLGLNFSGMGETEENEPGKTTTSKTGTFFPSVEYGKNFINNDFSMLLLFGRVGLRLPYDYGKTVVEQANITTTTMSTASPVRLEIQPKMWYFFKPKLEPRIVISHIYLDNNFVMQFYPEEERTVQQTGLPDDYTRRGRSYIGDTLLGYYNRQYTMSAKLALAWRVNLRLGFYYYKQDHTFEKTGGVETETKVTDEQIFLVANVIPRFAFAYQLIPGTLTLNGAFVLNDITPTQATGWYLYRDITTDETSDTVKTTDRNTFTSINPFFTLGAAWSISPYMTFESGFRINTSNNADNILKDISIGVVYKR
jgi:hypothetical protein